MTGFCPLCREIFLGKILFNSDARDENTVLAVMELIEMGQRHWYEQHSGMVERWITAEAASHYGNKLAWSSCVEVQGFDRRAFVFSLFWMRAKVLGVGFDPLAGRLAYRPMELETKVGEYVDPLVIQGRIEAYEDLLRAGAVLLSDVADRMKAEMDRYQVAVSTVNGAVAVERKPAPLIKL